MNYTRRLWRFAALLLAGSLITACSSDSDNKSSPPSGSDQTRIHDSRKFTVNENSLPFTGSGGNPEVANAKRYWGVYEGIQGPAGYRIEIPENWNGGLIMWTRGYGGEGFTLSGTAPGLPFRNAVLAKNYAWAASTYSANYYDVRAAAEDTNKLALEVAEYVKRDWDVDLTAPSRYLVAGSSLGGHTAAVLIEAETLERARYKVEYEGAMPMCQAEQNQYRWLHDYTIAAQHLAGYGDSPVAAFRYLRPLIEEALFVTVKEGHADRWTPTTQGQKLFDLAKQLTGGERPMFEEGFRSTYQNTVLNTGGRDGTVNGILAESFYDNTDRVYRWTTGDTPTLEEVAFNDSIIRLAAHPDANPLRDDGVRFFPLVHGNFNVPVLTMHTLGDFYVPFRHQQLYREGAEKHGKGDLLVQRAIRAAGHCNFSSSEMTAAVNDFLNWIDNGVKPNGDDVITASVVADSNYGCAFTDNTGSLDRGALPACTTPTP